jgi:hypothetical protein
VARLQVLERFVLSYVAADGDFHARNMAIETDIRLPDALIAATASATKSQEASETKPVVWTDVLQRQMQSQGFVNL